MTPMWHECIFICFIYVVYFFTRPYALSILALIFQIFKYLPHQDINDECIFLSEMQHSQPHMALYRADFFLIEEARVNAM